MAAQAGLRAKEASNGKGRGAAISADCFAASA